MTRSKTRRNLVLSVSSFFSLHFVASFDNLYRTASWVWIDIPVHFLGGLMMAAVFYWYFQNYPNHFDTSRSFWMTVLMVSGWVALTGVLWEFTEFLYDLAIVKYDLSLRTLQFGLTDTLGDLLSDLFGGFALAIFIKLRYHK